MQGNEKTPTVEVINRVEEITALLVAGFARKDILQFVAKERDWDVCSKTIDNYIHKARKKIEKACDTKTEQELGMSLKRLEELYRRSFAIQDYKSALSVVKEKNTLLGLYKPKQHELFGKDGKDISIIVTHETGEKE
jgi:hypothetical protein